MAYRPTTKQYGCIYMIVNTINNKVHGDYKKVIELNPQVSKYAVKYLIEYGIPYKPNSK